MWPEYDDAYEPSDPKHPTFFERYVEWADNDRKRDKENPEPSEPDSVEGHPV